MTQGDDAAFSGKDALGNDVYGMTKREYFAALALQGMIGSSTFGRHEFAAEEAVKYADALIDRLNDE